MGGQDDDDDVAVAAVVAAELSVLRFVESFVLCIAPVVEEDVVVVMVRLGSTPRSRYNTVSS